MIALAALLLAIGLCAVIVFAGPGAAERLVPLLPASQPENYALIETLFVVVLFGTMLIVALVAGRFMGVRPLAMGARPLATIPLGVAIGLGGILIATGYAALSGTLVAGEAGGATAAMLAWGVAVVSVQAGAEEVYFRGWLQPVLARAWGPLAAILLTAVAFSALHIMGGARSPLTLVNLFLGGVMFGLLAFRTGGIGAATGAHIAWNATEQLGLGLDPNPGIGGFGAAVDLELVLGRAIWGGSEEGLNASIAMTFALLAIVVPLAMTARWRRPAATPEPIARAVPG